MPSKKLTPAQAELQKVRLQEELDRRRANNTAGKQKSLTAKVKDLLPSALNNIKAVVEGEPLIKKTLWTGSPEQEAELIEKYGKNIDFIKEDGVWYKVENCYVDKTQYDASKWVVSNAMTLERHNFELKKLKLSTKKAEVEADAAGYGDKSPAKVKEQFAQKGLTTVGGFEYNPEWDEEIEEFEAEEDDSDE